MPTPQDENLVCTVGEMSVWPGASNVIPGHVGFSVDVRARTDAVRDYTVTWVTDAVNDTCKRRGVGCEVAVRHTAGAVAADGRVMEGMRQAVAAAQVGEGGWGGGRQAASGREEVGQQEDSERTSCQSVVVQTEMSLR